MIGFPNRNRRYLQAVEGTLSGEALIIQVLVNPTSPPALLRALAENWWLLLLRGIAAIAHLCLARPLAEEAQVSSLSLHQL